MFDYRLHYAILAADDRRMEAERSARSASARPSSRGVRVRIRPATRRSR